MYILHENKMNDIFISLLWLILLLWLSFQQLNTERTKATPCKWRRQHQDENGRSRARVCKLLLLGAQNNNPTQPIYKRVTVFILILNAEMIVIRYCWSQHAVITIITLSLSYFRNCNALKDSWLHIVFTWAQFYRNDWYFSDTM